MFRFRHPWRLFFSILKEAIPFIAITFFVLTTLAFAQQLAKYSNILFSMQAPGWILWKFIWSIVPGIIVTTLPISLVIGTVITCSRLSADGELTAAQSTGVSPVFVSLPFLFLGLLGSLLTYQIMGNVQPRSLKQLKTLQEKILVEIAGAQIKPDIFITTFPNVLLYVQDLDPKNGEWIGVYIYQNDDGNGGTRIVTAERGRLKISTTPQLSLEAELFGGVMLINKNAPATATTDKNVTGPQSQAISNFQKFSIFLSRKDEFKGGGEEFFSSLPKMTMKEIIAQAKSPNLSLKDKLRAKVELNKRPAIALTCLTLTAIAFVLSLRGRRFTTRPRTVIFILCITFVFYLLIIAGGNLALAGSAPVWLGVWGPHIIAALFVIQFISSPGKRLWFAGLFDQLAQYLQGIKSKIESRKVTGKQKLIDNDKITGSYFHSSFAGTVINIINYLLVSELVKFFAITLIALVATSLIGTLFDLIPNIARNSIPLSYALGYLAYLSPQFAYQIAPFAMLTAIMIAASVLARSNQLISISASGVSRLRIITTVLTISAFLGVGLWMASNWVLPSTNIEQDFRYNKIKNRNVDQITFVFGKKWVYGKNNTIYSYQAIAADDSLLNAAVYHMAPDKLILDKLTFFEKAVKVSEFEWKPLNGWSNYINPDLTVNRESLTSGEHIIRIEDGDTLFKRTANESSKMSSQELKTYITQLKSIGVSVTELKIDFQKRMSFPFSCISLGLLAMPFALSAKSRRHSSTAAVAVGVALSLIFWLFVALFDALGKATILPITIAVWAPQALLLAGGLYLNLRYKSL